MSLSFYVRNQNGTILGTHATRAEAEADAREYRRQTGNPAFVIPDDLCRECGFDHDPGECPR